MDLRKRPTTATIEDRYKVLLDVARILTATLQPEELYRTIHAQSKRVLELAGFSIALYDAATDLATVVYHSENDQPAPIGNSFAGSELPAIRHCRPEITADPADCIDCLPHPGAASCALMSPLVLSDQVIGLLCACSTSDRPYGQAELELLAAIADHAAVALANARFMQEREHRRRESDRLEEIGRALSASLDLPKVLERVASAALELTSADSAVVYLMRGPNSVEVAMTAGTVAPPRGLVFPFPESMRSAALARQTLVFEDTRDLNALPDYLRTLARTASSMAVMLVAEGEFVGALSIGHSKQRTYSNDEIRMLERLSYQAAIAVANARLHEQILALSLTDPLTGMPNRRSLELFLEKEFAAAKRGRRLTVMLFDLDNFKEYNDRVGHQQGDEALRAFGRVLIQQTRAMNLAARYGGDEFISILADTDRRGGVTHAARIARAIASHPLLSAAGLRASVGIASYSARMNEPADLIRAADRDLYSRKGGKELRI